MLPPLPRCSSWVYSSLISPRRISLPRFHCRVGLHIDLFEDCSAFTHVAACTLAQSPYFVTAIRGLQTFRHLHACPGCFRRERSPGGPCTHWKSAALSRRTWIADLRRGPLGRQVCAASGPSRRYPGTGRVRPQGDILRLALPFRPHRARGRQESTAALSEKSRAYIWQAARKSSPRRKELAAARPIVRSISPAGEIGRAH